MEIFHIGFLTIRLLDILDILLVGYLLYKLYQVVRGGAAMNIFSGVILIYVLWWVFAKLLNMQMMATIFGQFIGVGFIALIIVFQQEVRRFLILLGSNNFLAKSGLAKQFLPWNWQPVNTQTAQITPIIKACKSMSNTKTGAIIVLAKSTELSFYIRTGDLLEAEVSKRLLESIFFKNNPLHDGAVIISGNKIKAARCVLPVSENPDIPARLGMRHRAALGITEQTDAIVIVVSEETGELSFVKEGELTLGLNFEDLENRLMMEFR